MISWLGMQVVHELGHVLGALATQGTVTRVVLHPLTISRTDVAPNPLPGVVVWAGPLLGVFLPLSAWLIAHTFGLRWTYLVRFFAGFCLIANGAYIGVGSFEAIGDAGEMLRHGTPIWLLWAFGIATIPTGLWLWHRQGRHFGLGPARGLVDAKTAYAVALGLIVLMLVELLFAQE